MSYSWKFQVYRSWDEVDDPAFIEEWQHWMNNSSDAHVFSHPVMVRAWSDTYRSIQDIKPLYIVAETEGVTIFLPLAIWRRNWKNAFVKVIVPAGNSDYDYHDPIVVGSFTKSLMHSFWSLVLEKVLHYKSVGFDEINLSGIHIPGNQRSWVKEEACPYTDLRKYKNFGQFFERLGKNLRKDIRRRRRMLEEYGAFSFHVYEQSELQEALQVLPVFLETHSQKWPGAFKAPGFHEALLVKGLPAGLVHFSEIRIDSIPISWELDFRYRQKVYSYVPAYLERYAKCSPGTVHLSCLLEDCFKRGVQIFDFMRGSEGYKEKWTDSENFLYRYRQTGKSFQNRLRLLTNNVLKEIKDRLYTSSI